MRVDIELINLEDSIEQLSNKVTLMGAIVFSAGSGGRTGDDITLAIDLDLAVKIMDAAKKEGVSRFVMVSTIYADNSSQWKASVINANYIAKD